METLATAKDEVFRLNIEGTDNEKKNFVDEFNTKMSGNVKLGIRGGAVTPFFTAERQPTSKMFLVVGKEKDADGSEHNRVWTMTPGDTWTSCQPMENISVGSQAREYPKEQPLLICGKKSAQAKNYHRKRLLSWTSRRKLKNVGGMVVL